MEWIHVVIDSPAASAERSLTFWSEAMGWPAGAPWRDHPELRSFVPAGTQSGAGAVADDPYVHAQVIDGPPRVHLDLEVDDVRSETARLTGLGASRGDVRADWQVMASPGGLPFCLVPRQEHPAPAAPVTWPDGGRTRLVQICLDAPADLIDGEVRFWSAATGWRESQPSRPEFVRKLYGPPGSPVQILLQRLGADDSGTATRAHIDLGCDDPGVDAERLTALGASVTGSGDRWVALTDPTGLPFCVTDNPPD